VDAGSTHHVEVILKPTRAYLHDIEERARQRRNWSYVLGATGVAIAGTALGVGVWNQGRYIDWKHERTELEQDYQAPSVPAAELEQRRNDVNGELRSIHSVDIVTAMLGVTGGMLLGSGTLLLLTTKEPPRGHGQSLALQRARWRIGMNIAW